MFLRDLLVDVSEGELPPLFILQHVFKMQVNDGKSICYSFPWQDTAPFISISFGFTTVLTSSTPLP